MARVHPAHRETRAFTPRRLAEPVSLAGVPLLGPLHDQAGDRSTSPCGPHALVENHIERLKESGLCRFPFSDFEANVNWMTIVLLAADLVRWFQLLYFEGYWQAPPKALR